MSATAPAVQHEFFAACPRHVPDLLATELRALGLQVSREHPAGVSFAGTLRDGMAAAEEVVEIAVSGGCACFAGCFAGEIRQVGAFGIGGGG